MRNILPCAGFASVPTSGYAFAAAKKTKKDMRLRLFFAKRFDLFCKITYNICNVGLCAPRSTTRGNANGLTEMKNMNVFGIASLNIGGLEIKISTLIAAAVAIVLLVLTLVLIIKDIKKQKRIAEEEAAEAVSATPDDKASRGDKSASKKAKKKGYEPPATSPFVAMLGFDPYSPVEVTTVSEPASVGDQDTEEMRVLRERMQVARQTEEKIAKLGDRKDRVQVEIDKVGRFVRENNAVISAAEAVGDKLREEIATLTATKKIARKNKADVARLNDELAENAKTIAEINARIGEKSNEDKLLAEAFNYLTTEISKNERDLGFINSDIARLNGKVGAEMKRIEEVKRAKEIEKRLSAFKPVLTELNSADAELRRIDVRLDELAVKKQELASSLGALMNRLRTSSGAVESGDVSVKVNEINRLVAKADEEENELINRKESLARRFRQLRADAYDYIKRENCTPEEIGIAEDSILAEIEANAKSEELDRRKTETEAAYAEARAKYDELSAKKVKFRNEKERRAYEERMSDAIGKMRATRTAAEDAKSDAVGFDAGRAAELVAKGSGVISRELSKTVDRNDEVAPRITDRREDRPELDIFNAPERQTRYDDYPPQGNYGRPYYSHSADDYGYYAPPSYGSYYGGYGSGSNLPAAPIDNATLGRMLARLRELEAIAARAAERKSAIRTSSSDKIERKKAQVVAMRKNLRYVDGPATAAEFKHKLYSFSLSLDADEANDPVLSEMIRRTMDEATALGARNNRN